MRAELVSQLASAELTYHDVGATKRTPPAGYHHHKAARVIGNGAEAFDAAAAKLLGWQAHLRAGLRVTASTATAEPGTVVLLGVVAGPLRMRAPCRVVYTITEPQRKGFASCCPSGADAGPRRRWPAGRRRRSAATAATRRCLRPTAALTATQSSAARSPAGRQRPQSPAREVVRADRSRGARPRRVTAGSPRRPGPSPRGRSRLRPADAARHLAVGSTDPPPLLSLWPAGLRAGRPPRRHVGGGCRSAS